MQRTMQLTTSNKVNNIKRHLQRLSAVAIIALALLQPSAGVYAQNAADADTGDAPDSTNHANQKLESFPGSGIVANYPTVFDDPAGVPGPIHWYPTKDAWLGAGVSGEQDADQLPDVDGQTNIDPPANSADRDRFDDGVYLSSLTFSDCGRTNFRYNVTVAAASSTDRYINVWFDFNRDGDWDDIVLCKDGSGNVFKVPEWAVQDEMSPTALLPGSYNLATPVFMITNPPTAKNPMWMRITLSDRKAPPSPVTGMADGRGQPKGYRFGETEDYLLTGK